MSLLSKIRKIFLFSLLVTLFLASCTRSEKSNESKISISLPQSLKSNKMGVLSTSNLVHVSINITGGGILTPIVYNWDSDSHNAVTSIEAPSSFNFDVPKGTDRLFQILAVYSDTSSSNNGRMEFYYGDVTKTLVASTEDVPIEMSSVGPAANVVSGRIQGRYLTSFNDGPTSRVDIVYFPPGGKTPMIVDRSMIMAGWFQFFGLLGVKFGYRLEDGTLLWGGAVDLSESSFLTSSRVLRVSVPIHSISGKAQQQPQVYVYGFFGDASVIANRAICKDTTSALSVLLKTDASDLLTVKDDNSSDPIDLFDTTINFVNVRGGVSLGSTPLCDTQANITSNLFTSVQHFTPSLLENGNDNSAGFRLPFQISTASNGGQFLSVNVVDAQSVSVSATFLPGIVNSLDNFNVFKITNLGTNFNYHSSFAPCESLIEMKYSQVVSTPVSAASYSAKLPLTDEEAKSGAMFVLCPTKSGKSLGLGFWLQANNFRTSGNNNCISNCSAPALPATQIAFQNTPAVTVNQCASLSLNLFSSTNVMASASSNVTVSLSSSSGSFYDETDFNCSGTAINTVTIPANSSWKGLRFKVSITPGTPVTLTPTDSAAVLTSTPATVLVRNIGSVSQLVINSASHAANVGTCLLMTARTEETSGTLVPYNGPMISVLTGISIYSDASCSTVLASPTLVSGVSNFYVKSTLTGPSNIKLSTTIDGINFNAYYSLGIYAYGQPTHLSLSQPSPSYLYINQCIPIQVAAKDDMDAIGAIVGAQKIKFNASGGGAGNNFYIDSSCSILMSGYEVDVPAGTSTFWIYYKPQASGVLNIYAAISNANYFLTGIENYTIGNLWMHVIANGYNGSWFDTSCGSLVFELRDNYSAGAGAVVPNLSGSAINLGVNTNQSPSNGGLYSMPSCTDTVSNLKSLFIATGSSGSTIYMKSLVSSGGYINVLPTYSGTYSSIYQNGNTLTSLSFAWCPPFDGGGACPSSIALSGVGVSGGVAAFNSAVTVGASQDKTVTLTNSTGMGITLGTFTINGAQAADYSFKGGSYPGSGGTCSGFISVGASCTIVLTFTPTATSWRYANLNINYNSSVVLPLAIQGLGQ